VKAGAPDGLTVEQRALLKSSAPLVERWGAYLAGGSALALHLRHRRSHDFDFFTPRTLQPDALLRDLQSTGVPVRVSQNDVGTFHGVVGGVEYSVFRYPYPLVEKSVKVENCDVASLRDIAAMKMVAIGQRAAKRDYVDLHAILSSGTVTLADVLSSVTQKYRVDPAHSLRALTYFREVESQAMPAMLTRTSWEEVRRGLERVVTRELGRGGPSR
jgi:hypothetical protein